MSITFNLPDVDGGGAPTENNNRYMSFRKRNTIITEVVKARLFSGCRVDVNFDRKIRVLKQGSISSKLC